MIKNYFKIAWRNLINNKVDSTINIIGLVYRNGGLFADPGICEF